MRRVNPAQDLAGTDLDQPDSTPWSRMKSTDSRHRTVAGDLFYQKLGGSLAGSRHRSVGRHVGDERQIRARRARAVSSSAPAIDLGRRCHKRRSERAQRPEERCCAWRHGSLAQRDRPLDGCLAAADHHLPRGIIVGRSANLTLGRLLGDRRCGLDIEPQERGHGPFAHRYGRLHGLAPALQQARGVWHLERPDCSKGGIFAQGMTGGEGAVIRQIDAAFLLQDPHGRQADRHQGRLGVLRNVLIQYGRNVDAFESGAHLATVTADLLQAEIRDARVDDVLNLWRDETGTVPDSVALSFKEPQIGPAGLPIEIRLQGDDLEALKASSLELQAWLGRYTGVQDLQDDLRPGKPEMQLHLREGALAMGLDASTIASQLRAAYQGQTATEIQVGSESFEIDVQLSEGGQDSLADLDYFSVTLPDGSQAPLPAVAIIETGRGFARIQRIEGQRTVTIRGEVDSLVANVNEIIADTSAKFLPGLQSRYPSVSIALEGQAAEQEETGGSMQRGFMMGLLGIFLLLSFQFRSYVEPVIVMIAIPMALIGVIWGHLVMGLDLSMPSMMGMASLSGIVVNDSILLVTFVKRNAARGLALVDAARQASRDRFRPVLLTSVTTIAGLLPLLFERSLQAQVLIPLVTSIAFGLMASTVLILIVIPSAYAVLHDFGLSTVAREESEQTGEPATA